MMPWSCSSLNLCSTGTELGQENYQNDDSKKYEGMQTELENERQDSLEFVSALHINASFVRIIIDS